MTTDKIFKQFESKAGITFQSRKLLTTAFTHRSYINEARSGVEHNERLEFLGDAVLELVVTSRLFALFPKANEGDLTAYRAALVNATILGEIAERLGMNECLLLSKGEAKDTGRARASILANTFEAVVGALYLDQGYVAADDFIARHVMPHVTDVVSKGSFKDAKSRYQERAQSEFGATPHYETIASVGPDHARTFTVALKVGDRVIAVGSGSSKQEAEQSAAEKALDA